MSSPVRLHQQRVAALQSAAAAPHGGTVQGSAYELMQAQLFEHRRRLKAIQSVERKIEAKRAFLADYDAWIDGALAAGHGAQDQVFTTVLVWHIDTGSYARALQMATYALRHGMKLPDQYDRDLPTVLIDEISGAALAGKVPADQAELILATVAELTGGFDAPDQARAKLHKAIGYALIGKVGPADVDFTQLPLPAAQAALNHLRRALELFENVGVKKDMERLERRLRDSAAVAPGAA